MFMSIDSPSPPLPSTGAMLRAYMVWLIAPETPGIHDRWVTVKTELKKKYYRGRADVLAFEALAWLSSDKHSASVSGEMQSHSRVRGSSVFNTHRELCVWVCGMHPEAKLNLSCLWLSRPGVGAAAIYKSLSNSNYKFKLTIYWHQI